MKHFLVVVCMFFSGWVFGQTPFDTLYIDKEIDSLLLLSQQLEIKGDFQQMLDVTNLAAKKVEKVFGPVSFQMAKCLEGIGLAKHYLGKMDESESFLLDSKIILEKNLQQDSTSYADVLDNLGALYYDMGRLPDAMVLITDAKNLREKILGNEHPNYIKSLQNLGVVTFALGRYPESEKLTLELKQVTEKKLGKENEDYAMCLNELAVLYKEIGLYSKSEQYYIQAINILKNLAKEEYFGYALCLYNLGNLYYFLGRYSESEQMLLASTKVREKILKPEDTDIAKSLNSLGVLYKSMGRYNEAEKLYLQAKTIIEKTAGPLHPDFAAVLSNLGVIYKRKGEFATAEPFFIQSAKVLGATLGYDHPFYATSLNNLGLLYCDMQQYAKADSVLNIVEKIRGLKFGKEHPEYAKSLSNLASLYRLTNRYEESDTLINKSRNIIKKAFGVDSPGYILSTNEYVQLYYAMGEKNKIEKLILEADTLQKKRLIVSAKFLSENELNKYVNTFSVYSDFYLSILKNCFTLSSDLPIIAYDDALFYRGFLLENLFAIKRYAQIDTSIANQIDSLAEIRRHLSQEYNKRIVRRDMITINTLEALSNTIEKNIARVISSYNNFYKFVKWQEVRDHMQIGEAVIEFVAFPYYDSRSNPIDSVFYAALVLLPNDTAPHFIPLFEQRQLQALLNRPGFDEEQTIMSLYSFSSDLNRLIWQPLEPFLRNVKTVYYAPDGLLHQLNLAALLDENKELISRDRQWVRVGSTRELVTGRLAAQSFAKVQPGDKTSLKALVYGGITYDMDSLAFDVANRTVGFDSANTLERKDGNFRFIAEEQPATNAGAERGSGDHIWEPLQDSEREAEDVSALLRRAGFQAEMYKGLSASEERIKKMPASPRILHFATHGFAYPDPKKDPPKNFGDEPVYKLQDDPMLRSGLVLAGANYYWKNKRPLTNHEDGVLVAYEVRDLNLRNTELAVLSACQTGLGDVVGSEGVYGLQRAFRIAGAKFLIVSLWPVKDEQTQELMRLFYENWLEKEESLRDAFNHAQQALREKEPNPYLWAGFILIE